MTLLTLNHLSVQRGERRVVDDVSLRVEAGELIGLIGPNGAGKTTLMRAALGLLPVRGESSLAAMPARTRARAAAWLPQMRAVAWPVSVETLVALGRTPHLGPAGRLHPADHAAVEAALQRLELGPLRHRIATQLSGGEQARVLIARALAQDAPLLLADEPIAGLDPAHQITTMRVFADLAAGGHAVIAALHDLGLAARHCTRLILMGHGRLVADGPPAEVLSEENLRAVFGLRAYYAQTVDGAIFQPLEVIG